MNALFTSLADSVERVASGTAIHLDRKSAVHWVQTINNGSHHELDIRLQDNWLLVTEQLENGLGPASAETLWSSLSRNAGLPTEVRIVLAQTGRLSFRAEFMLAEDATAEQRVRDAIAAFEAGWSGQLSTVPASPEEWASAVERLCEESGWRCVRRSSGRLTVSLETSPALQATVNPAGHGLGVRLSVEVADYSTAAAVCRAAAARLALETAGQIRTVRAAADKDQFRLRYETLFAVLPCVEELAAGFANLSAAVALTADALGALQNENLAGDYLTIRGTAAATENQQPERTIT